MAKKAAPKKTTKKVTKKVAGKVAKKPTKKVTKKAVRKPSKKAAAKKITTKKAATKKAATKKKATKKKKWDWREGLTKKAKNRKNPYDTINDLEAAHIRTVLAAYGHDIQQTAIALGIARSTVYRKMKRYKIQ